MSGKVYKYTTDSGHKRWRIVYDLPPDPATGKRRQTSRRGFTRERDAQRALREALGKVDHGRHEPLRRRGEDPPPSHWPLSRYLTEWLAGRSMSDHGLANYRQSAECHVIPRLGGVKLQDLTTEHIDRLYRELERQGKRAGTCPTAGVTCREHGCEPQRHGGLAPKTVRHVHTMLRKALQDAVERGHIVRNPADLANPPSQKAAKSRSAEEGVWTGEQLRAFLAHLRGRSDRLYAMWMLFCTTGVRRSEALRLEWHDVDLDAATVRVPKAKSEAGERTMALDPETVTALRAHRKRQSAERLACRRDWQGGDRVFTLADGRELPGDTVLKALQRHAKAAGLPRTTVHKLRHAYATAALRAGVSPEVLSKRLGHADVSITLSIYAHVRPEDDAEAATKAAGAILGG